MSTTNISWRSIIAFTIATFLGIIASYFGHPLIHNNDKAVNIIVTFFSILSGFLVATIAIIGDPLISAGSGSWRFSELQRKNIKRRLLRHKWLFILYISTLFLIFISTLFSQYPPIACLVERAYFGLAVSAFLLSFRLPFALMDIQLDRYDDIIEEQRNNHKKT